MSSKLSRYYSQIVCSYADLMEAIGENLLLASIRRGLILLIPVVLTGSIALLFVSFPVPQYQSLMEGIFGESWKNLFTYVYDGTTSILSLCMVICISYSFITELGMRNNVYINPILAPLVSLCSFIALCGLGQDGAGLSNLGVLGAFVAILTATSASFLFYRLSLVKALRVKPFSDGDSVSFSSAVSSILPAAITISVFAALNQALQTLLNISDINDFISSTLSKLFLNINNPFLQGVLFIFLIHFLWFFGIHGSNMLEYVAQSVFVQALSLNQTLIVAGQQPTQIFTKTFFDTFVLMGGCGSAICLIAAMLILRKNNNQLRLARLSIAPLLFNINELIVFGFPIVLNPIYAIPFLLVPLLLTVTSFAAVSLGLVPYTIQTVEWTTPVFISGYYATGSFRGCLLQLFNLIVGTLCYVPFVKLSHSISASRIKKSYESLCTEFVKLERSTSWHHLLERQDSVGNLAKVLAQDLKRAVQEGQIALFYQPQVDYDGNVFCVEALFRWKHDVHGYIYPPLAIALAEELHIIDELGFYIIEQACGALRQMELLGHRGISVSVNITTAQLESEDFTDRLLEILRKHQVSPASLKIEITEQAALGINNRVKDTLHIIRSHGIELEMDDFGMGHSSLMYLKEYNFDTIKLDGSLVREIGTNANCREIISSIVFLSKSLNYHVLAEFVETEEQRQILHGLGCDQYQGYLFSQALPFAELIEYIRADCPKRRSDPVLQLLRQRL